MGALLIQNDFTHGELDRRLFSRVDLAIYNKAAQQLRNVVVIPQGGARRRFGTEFIFDAGTITEDEYRLDDFEFTDTIAYLLFYDNLRVRLLRDDIKVGPDVVTPYTGAMLKNKTVKAAQTHNEMVIVEPTVAPRKLTINTGTDTGTLSTITFRNLPAYDFGDTNYDGFTFTLGSATIGSTTLTSSSAVFTADHVSGLFISIGADTSTRNGVARITGFTSSTQVSVEVISDFGSTTSFGFSSFLGESAWNATRGFPSTVTFYEGRLWFGGTKELPQTIFGSVVNDFFNFDEGTGLDDQAIVLTMATNSVNTIRHITGDKSLQVFTSTGEFSVPQLNENPLTPSNVSLRKQSSNGADTTSPVLLDNQTFFVRRGGKGVMSFDYNNESAGYRSRDVSILSPQLIRNPGDSAALKGSTTDDANYLFMTNETDGTLAVYQSLFEEAVSAWTLSNTQGASGAHKFKRVQEVQDNIYFLVNREINSVEKTYIEKLNFSKFTDSTNSQSFGVATTVISGLSHLEGETVRVRGETTAGQGFFVLDDQVVAGGQITLETGVFTVEIGLNFNPVIQPMPVNIVTQIGDAIYVPKRLTRFFIDFYQSTGVFVEGDLIPWRLFDPTGTDFTATDSPPQTFSEVVEYNNLGGWDVRQAPIITQPDPLPMTILGIGYEVEL